MAVPIAPVSAEDGTFGSVLFFRIPHPPFGTLSISRALFFATPTLSDTLSISID
jgi:hypothetical protein